MTRQEEYDALIEGARKNPSTLPGQVHHIVPKSIHRWRPMSFGINAPENLVRLSHQQHLIAHYLLWEIWKGNKMAGPKMATAYTMMANVGEGEPTPEMLEAYAEAKIASSKALSEAMSGEGHPFYGMKRPEHSKAMSGERNHWYGKPRSEGAGRPSKPVINTETGEIWESLNACARGLDKPLSTMQWRVEKKCFGGIWMFLEDYNKEKANG
jgi:hypothetical protein